MTTAPPLTLAAHLRELADAIERGVPTAMPLLLTGEACGIYYLVTLWEDGSVTLATRTAAWETWSAPMPLAVSA
jgi:hypothetical protein